MDKTEMRDLLRAMVELGLPTAVVDGQVLTRKGLLSVILEEGLSDFRLPVASSGTPAGGGFGG